MPDEKAKNKFRLMYGLHLNSGKPEEVIWKTYKTYAKADLAIIKADMIYLRLFYTHVKLADAKTVTDTVVAEEIKG
jgi:hypothetical protein